MTLIVIEGVDGAGKSTLVQSLEPDMILHSGPLKEPPLNAYVNRLLGIDVWERNVVLDRWHVGELVYGPVYRGESKLTEAMRRYVEMFLETRGATKLICEAPIPVVQRRLEQRGEDFLQPEDLDRVWRFYRTYGSDHGWSVVDTRHLDTTVLASIASMHTDRARIVREYPQYVGSLRPDVVFVVPSYATDQHHSTLSPTAGSAAELFFNSIPDHARIGVTTIYPDMERMLSILHQPRVVALGDQAASRLREAMAVPDYIMPHPTEIAKYSPSRAPEYGSIAMQGVARG